MLIGAGTLLNAEDLRRATECWATFGVAPGFNPDLVREALKINFPFSPGVMIPSDVEGALNFGIRVLKFFPAGAAGGVKMPRSIAAPYTHLGVRFIRTGGVNADNMKDYLEQEIVLAVGGVDRNPRGHHRWSLEHNPRQLSGRHHGCKATTSHSICATLSE